VKDLEAATVADWKDIDKELRIAKRVQLSNLTSWQGGDKDLTGAG
jgi:transcription initiation factor TFIIIB Brf1 subunit/transcription initiation factor TFIIB